MGLGGFWTTCTPAWIDWRSCSLSRVSQSFPDSFYPSVKPVLLQNHCETSNPILVKKHATSKEITGLKQKSAEETENQNSNCATESRLTENWRRSRRQKVHGLAAFLHSRHHKIWKQNDWWSIECQLQQILFLGAGVFVFATFIQAEHNPSDLSSRVFRSRERILPSDNVVVFPCRKNSFAIQVDYFSLVASRVSSRVQRLLGENGLSFETPFG